MKGFKLLFIWCLGLVLTGNSVSGQDSDSENSHPELKKFDTLYLHQQNGPKIHIIGYGKRHLSYSETIDGYTVLRNKKGVYEYAERAAQGDLKPSGIVAHDPKDRSRKELLFIRKTPKHLRYQPPKLNKILNKNNRFWRIKKDKD